MTQKTSLYEFKDYRGYLTSKLGEKSTRRGLKSALAKAIQCQPTYISQILNGTAEMSPEQAISLNQFFSHTKEESHFFLLLLNRDRAGNQGLKKYYNEQINDVLEKRLNLSKRLGIQNSLDEEQKNIFYSSWQNLAILIGLTIPELQTKEALAQHLQLPLKRVGEIIEFLILINLVQQSGGRFFA